MNCPCITPPPDAPSARNSPSSLLLLLAVVVPGCQCGEERSASQTKAIQSLPYLSWVPVSRESGKLRGVVKHQRARAFQGLNIYNSKPRSRAHLMDMDGAVVHTWSTPEGQPTASEARWSKLWPQLDIGGWHHVEPTPTGDLFVILGYHMLMKLDRRSRIRWKAHLPAHHDLDLDAGGRIYTLMAKKARVQGPEGPITILDSHVAILSPGGRLQRTISLFRALERDRTTAGILRKKVAWAQFHQKTNFVFYQLMVHLSLPKESVAQITRTYVSILANAFKGSERVQTFFLANLQPTDILHANSIQILPRARRGLWSAGDLLVSIRELDLTVVMAPATGRIKWSGGPGVVDHQHQPTALKNGNVLVFDNGPLAKRSRVLEVDPGGGKIVWSYQGTPPGSFFSAIGGGCQALPNGNVLITESVKGRVFEVTRAGQTVWDFHNPDMDNPYVPSLRAPIYRMARLPKGFFTRAALASPVKAPHRGTADSTSPAAPSP